MTVAITCRGCGTRVSRTARYCYLCKCLHPTCHLPQLFTGDDSAPEPPLPTPPPARAAAWGWLVPAGFGIAFTLAASVAVRLLAR